MEALTFKNFLVVRGKYVHLSLLMQQSDKNIYLYN